MRSLAVLILAGAVLALVVGCNADEGDEDVEPEEQTKSQQIREATEKLLGGEIPAQERR